MTMKMTMKNTLLTIAIALVAGVAGGYGIASLTFESRLRALLVAQPALVGESIDAGVAAQRDDAIRRITADGGGGLKDDWTEITAIGNPAGNVTIYEFSDYNCGFCKRSLPVLEELLANDGNLRLVVKEFPILSESSTVAARTALAVARLGRYADYHHALMARQGRVDEAAIAETVASLGIAPAAIEEALTEHGAAIDAALAANRELAQQLGINGTPGFIIGSQIIPGAVPLEDMQKAVNDARKNS